MKLTVSIPFIALVVACAEPPTTDTGASIKVNTATDLTEPAYVNGVKCTMVFPGALTSSTMYYQIWPVGTNGLVDTPYNTSRPNVYAVFGTGAAASDTHHVDGYSQFDHYHVLENNRGTDVDNTKWDLMAFFPGPNFNAATYQTAHSATELFAQSAAGVLSPMLTTGDLGFPPAVLYSPVNCPGH